MKSVSVVMCTYNGAKYIREQLDSIINQTYPIFEIIIQDDCYTDDTVESASLIVQRLSSLLRLLFLAEGAVQSQASY